MNRARKHIEREHARIELCRKAQILQSRGYTNQQIAAELGIAEGAVRNMFNVTERY